MLKRPTLPYDVMSWWKLRMPVTCANNLNESSQEGQVGPDPGCIETNSLKTFTLSENFQASG